MMVQQDGATGWCRMQISGSEMAQDGAGSLHCGPAASTALRVLVQDCIEFRVHDLRQEQ